MTRQRPALGDPAGRDLRDFPATRIPEETTIARVHQAGYGPWWFASAGPDDDDGGRFDLPTPDGTCYVAFSPEVALREAIGPDLVGIGVGDDFLEARVCTQIAAPADWTLADTCDKAAVRHGVTREIGTLIPYGLPRRWAAALRTVGFHGIHYLARLSSGMEDVALALFGPAGECTDVPSGSITPAVDVADRAGIPHHPRPRRASLTVLD